MIRTTVWSDHAPISITIQDSNLGQNAFIWRANNSIIQNDKYTTEIKDHINDFFLLNKGSVSDPAVVWSAHKAYMRGMLLKMGAYHKRKRTQRVDELMAQIETLELKHKSAPHNPTTNHLLSLRQELKVLLLHSYEFLQRKFKATTYSTSNKAGKKLAQRLKGRRVKTKIPLLIHPHTSIPLSDPQDIADAFSAYYGDLYNLHRDPHTLQPSQTDIDNFLQNLKLPTLTDDQLTDLNAPFTPQEIKTTIESLPNGKAPGPDGMTGEYYKQYAPQLVPHLTELFNHAASSSSFSKEYLSALVITLPKPGKASNVPQNFRPISLLNLDLKIYAKTIATRLIQIMPMLIHPDQSGFTKGRQSSDATRRMINIIHQAEITGTPSLLLSLDAEKAFDRVHWTYLHTVLKKFGFQGTILNAIMALYSNPEAQVYTEGMLSRPFPITNGTRQGCPLSPIIFNLLMEPLAEHIRSHPNISGLITGNVHHKISLFADDVILILTNPSGSLAEVQKLLNWFSSVSYYKVNTSKSFILDVNIDATMKNLLQTQYPFAWATTDITYLGIHLPRTTKNLYSCNFPPLLQTIQAANQQIAKHELSWTGRLAAFKMICLPQLLYYFRTIPIPLPTRFFRSLQTLFNRFLWNGKRPRCAHSKLTKHKLAGGMGSIDFEDYHLAAILAQLPGWFHPNPTTLWGQIEETSLIHPNLKTWLLSIPLGTVVPTYLSPTMKASAQAWSKLKASHTYTSVTPQTHIPLQVLHHLILDLPLTSWTKKGIQSLQDILHDNSIKPFPQLQSEFNLATTDYFTYLRIRHRLSTIILPNYTIHPKTWEYLTNTDTKTKGISYFYNTLHQKQTFSKTTEHHKWEKDLACIYTESQWQQALKTVYKATKCAALWELMQKISLRWYLTPARLSSFNPKNPNTCWRCKSSIGDMFHVFWSCPSLRTYWEKIFRLISTITHIEITPSPALAILNLTIEDIPFPFRHVTTHILLAARLNLTRQWKSDGHPTLTQVVDIVALHFSYEITLVAHTGQATKTRTYWQPWKDWTDTASTT